MKKSIFQETLGSSPHVKVLDFLIANHSSSFTLYDLLRETKVSHITLQYLMPKMLKRKLVTIERKVGRARLYKLNTNNPAIKYLMGYDWK